MPIRSKVAVLRTQPETVLEDYQRLFELADGRKTLDPEAITVLKDNISWHYPMPGANTTPWQLEGTILALRRAGFADLVCVISELNHDWVHWPLKEKHVYQDWRAHTAWGQLFQRYQAQGYLASAHVREVDR